MDERETERGRGWSDGKTEKEGKIEKGEREGRKPEKKRVAKIIEGKENNSNCRETAVRERCMKQTRVTGCDKNVHRSYKQ